MNGLIRGKRLVWVLDGKCWKAESQFGTYTVEETINQTWCWSLTAMWDGEPGLINHGEDETAEIAKAACQSDHDRRAMASIQVGPFEWIDDVCAKCGAMTIRVWTSPKTNHWNWDILAPGGRAIAGDYVSIDRDAAITAAEQFVTRLVMGERE